MPDVTPPASLDADAQIALTFVTGRAWRSLAPDRHLAWGTAVAAAVLAAGAWLGGAALIAAMFTSGLITALLLMRVVTAEDHRAADLTAQAAQMSVSSGALRRARQAVTPHAAARRVLLAGPGFLPLVGALGLIGVNGRATVGLVAAFGVASVMEQWRRLSDHRLALTSAALEAAAAQRDAAGTTEPPT